MPSDFKESMGWNVVAYVSQEKAMELIHDVLALDLQNRDTYLEI